jgi:hypothetical protein
MKADHRIQGRIRSKRVIVLYCTRRQAQGGGRGRRFNATSRRRLLLTILRLKLGNMARTHLLHVCRDPGTETTVVVSRTTL